MPESVEEFLARGGEIQQIAEGVMTITMATIKKSKKSNIKEFNSLEDCNCGCEGDYTDHSMRLGEKGIY